MWIPYLLGFALVAVVRCRIREGDARLQEYRNMTIWQALRSLARSSDPQFIGMASSLQTNCTAHLQAYLDDPNQTITLFAPRDGAFHSLFRREVPFRYIGCGREECQGRLYDLGSPLGFNPLLMRNCLPEIVAYHIVPGLQFVSLARLDRVGEIVTVLPTALNSTSGGAFVNLAQDTPQALIVNQTATGSTTINRMVNFGILPPARITLPNITCLNGVIQGIDRVLIPPASLFESLQVLAPQSPGGLGLPGALKTPDLAAPVMALSNITVFYPASGFNFTNPQEAVLRSISSLYNYTEYVIPGRIIYNNQTSGSLQVNTVSGIQRTVQFARNYSMSVDGVPVVASNILIKNGILHLLGRPFQPGQIPLLAEDEPLE